MPTALRRRLPLALLAAVALVAAACGGEGGQRDATALLDRAFEQPVPSADVEIDLQLDAEGVAEFEDPLRLRASGPYVRAAGALPRLDMDVEIRTQGAGQAIQAGLLSTGERVFVGFGGSYYEQPPEQVARANRRLARDGGGDGSLGDLGLSPRAWVVDAAVRGDEQVGGQATRHVTGTLDVAAVLRDLNRLVDRSAGALGDSEQAPRSLGRREIERLSRTVEDPSFDVYVGKDDDVVRRISLRLELTVPERDRGDVGGATGASIRLAVELSDVGGDQEIAAPRESRPMSELTSQLGGLGAIAGGGLGDVEAPSVPGDEPGVAPDPDAGAADVFERYGECLEQASPGDAEAIARCSELVR